MRGRYGQPLRWTPERVAEAIAEWDRLGSSIAAAEGMSRRWSEVVTGAQLRNAVGAASRRRAEQPAPASEPARATEPPPPHPAISPGPVAGLVAVLADLHVPDHDEQCIQAFERWCAAAKPSEIIIAGDFLELESASEHPGARPCTIEDDLAAGVKVMRRILALCPRVTLREGNHSTRAARTVQHRVPSLASRFRAPLDDLADLGVDVHRHQAAPLRRGRLLVLHGDEGVRGGGKYAGSVVHSRRMLELYGEPGAVLVYGHFHRSQHHVRPMEMGNCEAHCLPCMRTLHPEWLGAEVSGWEQGWAAVQLEPGRRPTIDVIRYESGAAYWGGQRF